MWNTVIGPEIGSASELASIIAPDASGTAEGDRANSSLLGELLAGEPWTSVDTLTALAIGPEAAGSASSLQTGAGSQLTTQASTGSTLIGSSGGLQINLVWDASVSSAPAGFKTAAITAATYFTQMYSNAEVINIDVGYGEVDGVAIPKSDISESMRSGSDKSYSSVLTALKADAGHSALQAKADSTLPATDPLGGGKVGFGGQPIPDYYVSYAEQKALGMLSATGSETDGYIGMSSTLPMDYSPPTGSGQYDVVGSFEHEISEVMGRFASLGAVYGSGIYTPMDLFRYASPGVRDKTGTATSPYFSIDGGATRLAPYDTKGGDPADWASVVRGDAFGYGYAGTTDTVSPVDLGSLAVLGYNLTPAGLAATKTLTPLA